MIDLGVTFGNRCSPSVRSLRHQREPVMAIASSALESAVFDMNRGRSYRAECVQETRTAAIFYFRRGRLFCAMDDTPWSRQNLILSLSYLTEGALEKRVANGYVLPKNDVRASAAVQRAKNGKRVFEVDDYFQQGEAHLSCADFESAPFAQAIFGQFARPYGHFLESKKYEGIWVRTLTPESVADFNIGNGYLVDMVNLEGFRGNYGLVFDSSWYPFLKKCVLGVQDARGFEVYDRLAKKS
ncbi:hypothetical protein J4207_01050 [Candidatus Woesearchaeota archaeon]|nr:hypothetical protein [Candidatus Woesearchaeota archaeon]